MKCISIPSSLFRFILMRRTRSHSTPMKLNIPRHGRASSNTTCSTQEIYSIYSRLSAAASSSASNIQHHHQAITAVATTPSSPSNCTHRTPPTKLLHHCRRGFANIISSYLLIVVWFICCYYGKNDTLFNYYCLYFQKLIFLLSLLYDFTVTVTHTLKNIFAISVES